MPRMTTTIGRIERLDPRLDALVPRAAAIEVLASGFAWSEGPIWRHADGALLFSDIPANRICRWKQGEGLSTFLQPSGYTGAAPRGGEIGSNGLTMDRDGRLTLCEHGDRRLTRIERDGRRTVLADRWQGKRLNSPNDLVWHPGGDLYFTDPPYGLERGADDPARELPFCGVFRARPDGALDLLTDELSRPNGLAFSPDRSLLYVANSDFARALWMAYPVRADGTLGAGKVFLDLTADAKPRGMVPDGMKVDAQGNVFAAGPGGVCVITPRGELLGRIDPGDKVSNCNWGDDGSTLYLTVNDKLCRIRLSTRGDRWPW
jgi:gluconolactonase